MPPFCGPENSPEGVTRGITSLTGFHWQAPGVFPEHLSGGIAGQSWPHRKRRRAVSSGQISGQGDSAVGCVQLRKAARGGYNYPDIGRLILWYNEV